MTLKEIKDKLEIGLKPDAPYRPNNLPESELPHGPDKSDTDSDKATGKDKGAAVTRKRRPRGATRR